MKKILMLGMLLAAMSASAYEFRNVTAVQRWPWNNLVDISFDVTQPAEARGLRRGAQVEVTAHVDGRDHVLAAETLSDTIVFGEGRRTLTWNPMPLFGGRDLKGITFSLRATASNLPLGYMVVKLDDGTVTYKPLSFSNEVNTTTYKTTHMAFRYIPASVSGEYASAHGGKESFRIGTSIDTSNSAEVDYYGINAGDTVKEKPAEVTLTKGFFMGVFPMTRAQYQALGGTTNSPDEVPIRGVSYRGLRGEDILGGEYCFPKGRSCDANTPIGRIRARTGLRIDFPTDAQWEYACRAGTTGEYFFVDAPYGSLTTAQLNAKLRDYTPMDWNAAVGMAKPNPWGLYDMIGCCHQWTTTLARRTNSTANNDNFVQHADAVDPEGEKPTYDEPYRYVRGSHCGAGGVAIRVYRSSYRYQSRTGYDNGIEKDNTGCRLALTLEDF